MVFLLLFLFDPYGDVFQISFDILLLNVLQLQLLSFVFLATIILAPKITDKLDLEVFYYILTLTVLAFGFLF